MVTRTYANCLLTIVLSNLGIFAYFWPKLPRFFSLFSVTLLTIQEVTFNEINNLHGGGLQVKTGRWSRQRTENRDLKYEIARARPVPLSWIAVEDVTVLKLDGRRHFCASNCQPTAAPLTLYRHRWLR